MFSPFLIRSPLSLSGDISDFSLERETTPGLTEFAESPSVQNIVSEMRIESPREEEMHEIEQFASPLTSRVSSTRGSSKSKGSDAIDKRARRWFVRENEV